MVELKITRHDGSGAKRAWTNCLECDGMRPHRVMKGGRFECIQCGNIVTVEEGAPHETA